MRPRLPRPNALLAISGRWSIRSQEVRRPQRRPAFAPSGLPGERVTSTYRNPARNARVGGVANSYHTRRDAQGNPMARDSVPPPGMSMDAYWRELRRLNPGLDVLNEGDHIHLEPKGR